MTTTALCPDCGTGIGEPHKNECPQETDEELFMEARYPTDADEQEISM